jgi:hypothetical protein
MAYYPKPPHPVHVPGTSKGEELALKKKEPGRAADNRAPYRSARDSTGINAAHREPIVPGMPNIPPA